MVYVLRALWADKGCLWDRLVPKGLADKTINEGKVALQDGACVGEVDGLLEVAFVVQDVEEGTIDVGKI